MEESLERDDRPPYLYLLLKALEMHVGNTKGIYAAISELPCQEELWVPAEQKCNATDTWIDKDLNINYWGAKAFKLSNPMWKPKDVFDKYDKLKRETEKVYALLEDNALRDKVVDRGEVCGEVKKRFRRAPG
uniref:Uncharacterized protein n=1 Tax=Candidatus Kentrum sp. LFY TaxID=2126342 RepID=A0A450WWD2_9GAMM|nr:MAG: hypothetical protein BECKLFY1418C_GA0070996_10925 [Candidatus Kentron sp. LFY]